MSEFWTYFNYLVQPEGIIKFGGIYVLLAIVFIENGLFFGFFLPGDSLIFAAGLFCFTKVLPYPPLTIVLSLILSVSLGSLLGYYFGKKAGPNLYDKKESFFFRRSYLEQAEVYLHKYGGLTLILGRFLPIVRTFAPIIFGIVNYDFKKFMLLNIVGAVIWIVALFYAGYFLSERIPNAEHYLGYIIIGLITVTSMPAIITIVKKKYSK